MDRRFPSDIAQLVELFAAGGWKEIRGQGSEISLLLSNDPATPALNAPVPSVPVPAAARVAVVAAPESVPAATSTSPSVVDSGWNEVCAPNLGTFYRAPKPGAAPFVEVGQRVESDTEICLLEVMKLFTSVKAGLRGTIRKVCVEDGVLVEGGQLLFLVEAD